MPELSWRRLPTLLLHALRYELGLYRSLGRWLARRPDHGEPGDVPVAYARSSTPVIWLWIFGSACEIPLVHVLVPWHGVRIALLAVGVWGLVWMVGLLASLWVHPHLLTPSGLRVRNGAGHDVLVPWTAVTGVTARRRDLPSSMWVLQPVDTPEGTVLQVAVSGQVNVHLALRGPTEVVTAKGPMTVTAVSFFADDARAAAGLVRDALGGTGSAPRRPPPASNRPPGRPALPAGSPVLSEEVHRRRRLRGPQDRLVQPVVDVVLQDRHRPPPARPACAWVPDSGTDRTGYSYSAGLSPRPGAWPALLRVNEDMRYADPGRCPGCRHRIAPGARGCPACGLPLAGPVAGQLFAVLSHADELLDRLRLLPVADAGEAPTRRTTPVSALPEGLRGTSVPRILLALGALCLLVAALVFLAVAWSAMGVAGRTTTLLLVTVVAGAVAGWAARRNLRAATEALAVVALGLLTFDVLGARQAGWLGDPTSWELLLVTGLVQVVAGTAAAAAVRRSPVRTLRAAEAVAVLGLGTALLGGLGTEVLPLSPALVVAVVTAAGAAGLAHALRLPWLLAGTAALSAVTWLALLGTSLVRATSVPELGPLWLRLQVWPLLAAAATAGLPAALRRLGSLREVFAGVGVGVAALAVLVPVVDEPATAAVSAVAACATMTAAGSWLASPRWRRSFAAPAAVLAVPVTAVGSLLAVDAAERLAAAGSALWGGSAGAVLPPAEPGGAAGWVLPVAVVATAVVAAAVAGAFASTDARLAPLLDPAVLLGVAVGTVVATAASYPVPLWAVLALPLSAGTAFTVRALNGARPLQWLLVAGLLGTAVIVSLHDQWLTLVVLAVVTGCAAPAHLRARPSMVGVAAGLVLTSAAAGLTWTALLLLGLPHRWAALGVLLVLAAVVLAGTSSTRLGAELGAAGAALVAGSAGVGLAAPGSPATWAAAYLTVAGAAVSATAMLRADRRPAGWLGGGLLLLASWVRLVELGVEAPEAYTLPAATALLAVGLLRLRRDRAEHTGRSLTPGLLLALAPSTVWALAEPVSLRALLLGAACLALVVAGTRLRWSAPLVHGAAFGAVLVLRQVTPLADAVPRWALIGTAGALLVAMGITWEQRLRDARSVAAYVRALR